MVLKPSPEVQGAIARLHQAPDGQRVLSWLRQVRDIEIEGALQAGEGLEHRSGRAAAINDLVRTMETAPEAVRAEATRHG